MEGRSTLVNGNDTISVMELKRLLHELKDYRSETLIRFRLLGQMWQPNFLKIFVVNDTGVVLIDPTNKKMEMLTSLSDVIQFELDTRYQLFQPYFHYKVQADY